MKPFTRVPDTYTAYSLSMQRTFLLIIMILIITSTINKLCTSYWHIHNRLSGMGNAKKFCNTKSSRQPSPKQVIGGPTCPIDSNVWLVFSIALKTLAYICQTINSCSYATCHVNGNEKHSHLYWRKKPNTPPLWK